MPCEGERKAVASSQRGGQGQRLKKERKEGRKEGKSGGGGGGGGVCAVIRFVKL